MVPVLGGERSGPVGSNFTFCYPNSLFGKLAGQARTLDSRKLLLARTGDASRLVLDRGLSRWAPCAPCLRRQACEAERRRADDQELRALRLSRETAVIPDPCLLARFYQRRDQTRQRRPNFCTTFVAIRAGAGLFLELQHDVFGLRLGAVETLFYKVICLLLQHLDIEF
jgi:hypothetical protein